MQTRYSADVITLTFKPKYTFSETEEETLKVKDVENNTGPATAAGALGLCFGGVIVQRIRFRKKL